MRKGTGYCSSILKSLISFSVEILCWWHFNFSVEKSERKTIQADSNYWSCLGVRAWTFLKPSGRMTPWELFMKKEVTENSSHLQSMFYTFKEILKMTFWRTLEQPWFLQHKPNTLSFPLYPSHELYLIINQWLVIEIKSTKSYWLFSKMA